MSRFVRSLVASPSVVVLQSIGGQNFDDERNGLRLAGGGVRTKFGFINVYAVGLYTSPWYKGDLRQVDTQLRFALLRDLDNKTFVDAIETQLKLRVKDDDQIDRFVTCCRSQLPGLMPASFATALHLDPAGHVHLAVGDDIVGSVFAPDVADALLDVYIGDNAVSPSARDNILGGLVRLKKK